MKSVIIDTGDMDQSAPAPSPSPGLVSASGQSPGSFLSRRYRGTRGTPPSLPPAVSAAVSWRLAARRGRAGARAGRPCNCGGPVTASRRGGPGRRGGHVVRHVFGARAAKSSRHRRCELGIWVFRNGPPARDETAAALQCFDDGIACIVMQS